MAKVVLTDLVNLQNENTATTNINANNAAIEAALEKTLSRDGTSPNQMGASLDMNSHRILNLPVPTFSTDPVRLQELSTVAGGGTVSNIPAGGNSGDVLTKTSATNYAIGWTAFSADITAGTNIVVTGTSPATIATSLTPTFTTVNGLTLTATTGTLSLTNAKTLTISNTLTFSGTDTASVNFAAGGTVAYTGTGLQQFASTTSAQLAGVLSDETGSGLAVFNNSPSLITPILGTPTSGTLTSCTGLPISTGVSGLAAGVAAFLTTPSSANLITAVTDETGTGALVFANSPVLVTPNLGTPSAAVLTNATGTAASLTAGYVTTNANLTGDVTSVGNASTIAANAVTNSKLATMNAWTFKVNNTSSSATPTDITIDGLTVKASPAAGDEMIIWDVAGTALKKATISSIASAGSVASIAGNTGAFTLANGIDNSTNQIQLTAARRTLPTVQTFTSGTAATYTTPANCLWIEVFMVGGGGGGGGATSGVSATVAGADGTKSTFNSIDAAPGKGAAASFTSGVSQANGGAGGTGGTGTATRRMAGSPGASAANTSAELGPAHGGSSVLFGGGAQGVGNTTHIAGANAVTNTGGGGSGAMNQTVTNNNFAAGGGGAESVYLLITAPAATYTYTVGTGGAGGSSTDVGGNGAAGQIQVIEHYGT